ncbi:phosphatase PAP2 family protein [Pseudarthrobacter sp. J1763]|uniref:phosphatase PAP2 family protein n=1 Tax=Pseudarthrobacter sp. J1763 TaxID=3420445 RepID=UPI003D2BC5E2
MPSLTPPRDESALMGSSASAFQRIRMWLRPTAGPIWSAHAAFFTASVLIVLGNVIFWWMLASVASNSGPATWDGPLHSAAVASRNSLFTALMSAVTTVTSPMAMAAIGSLTAVVWFFWRHELRRPLILMVAMAGTVALSSFIKHQVGRPRPSAKEFLLGPDDALSFPSGHTLGSGVFFGVLAYLLVSRLEKRTTALLAAIAAVLGTALVGLSRVYLGYHWFTDVVASGSLALVVTGVVMLVDSLLPRTLPDSATHSR